MSWFSRPPTSPHECVLAFALPTTRHEFARDLRQGARKDFATFLVGHPADQEQRAEQLADLYEAREQCCQDVIASALACGVEVILRLDLATFGTLFDRFRIVTLVSHGRGDGDPGHRSPDERIEFFDGLYPVEEVAAQVPPTFTGLLDLTLCHSLVLAEEIKRCSEKRQFTILANRYTTELLKRLLLYKHAMRLVASKPMDYRDALLALHEGFLLS